MPERLDTKETNDILKVLIQAMNNAGKINKDIKDEKIQKEIKTFLKTLENSATKFFRDNIDRRKEVREKSVADDLLDFYKIKDHFL